MGRREGSDVPRGAARAVERRATVVKMKAVNFMVWKALIVSMNVKAEVLLDDGRKPMLHPILIPSSTSHYL